MDPRKLIEVLRATIDPNQRQQAEEQLNQVHKIIGFAPSLLQLVMTNDLEMPIRQAGVIYLKNLILHNWEDWEGDLAEPLPFNIHEQDRAMIRDSIIDAIVHAPDLIRVQLAICIARIVKHDFPGRWTGIVDKVSIFLQNPDTSGWMGALLSLHQLVKNYEYKKPEERAPLTEAMHLLLPMIHQRCVLLLPDQSEYSVALQKQILKIFFALVQYFLPLDLISKEMFALWMELIRAVVDRPIPEHVNQVDEEERGTTIWWKCKKWALHILTRIFERYGNPGDVAKEYKQFAEYYLKNFSGGILAVLLKVLDQYRRHEYVAPRVLQLTLQYINLAVSHAFSWKFLKPNMMAIVHDVVFPLLCYTDQDEELWTTQPHEYIRIKFDIFEDFVSPVMAAQTLLHTIAKKRKDMLQGAMAFVLTILTNPSSNPRQKDGALHMVGTVADILLKRQLYKEQMELMIVTHVFPEFQSPYGYMRARACWVLHHFSEIRFKCEANLVQALEFTQHCLLNDKDLPVRVEAAMALQFLISCQDKAQKMVEPNIKQVILELLKIIRETQNDDLTSVMQRLVCTYTQQVMPIAVEMTQHLAATFSQVMDGDESSQEKALTAIGLLNTIETILHVMEDNREIMIELEKIVINVIGLILTQEVMDFYEEALSLVYSVTSTAISPDMWKVFEMMYQMLQKDGIDYFTDMMPALHNFVTVDTPAFVSNENHLLAVFNMCKAVLTQGPGEDTECYAVKLLEVVLLQCKGVIDQCVPSFVGLAVKRLTEEVKTAELRTMCMQVVIAALQYNPQLLLRTLEEMPIPNGTTKSMTTSFIEQWIHDTDCFLGLHDRKVCVLGLCTLISLGQDMPQAVTECAPMIVPSLILLFNGLKRAYAHRAQAEEEDSDEEDEEDEDLDQAVLESDEDDIDEEGQEYLERLQEKATDSEDDDYEDDDDDDDDGTAETALDTYTTPLDADDCPIDEYIIFKEVLHNLQSADPTWYSMLTTHLTPDQQKSLGDIFVLADQRKAAAESKRIEQSGGYVFQNQTVPTSFNFGGTLS